MNQGQNTPQWLPAPEELARKEHIAIPEPTSSLEGVRAAPLVSSPQKEAQTPLAYITEADSVFCDECWHDRQHDIGDRDPNGWLFAKQPWHPKHVCACCGSTDGAFRND